MTANFGLRAALLLFVCVPAFARDLRFTVATYNLENYHLQATGNRPAKSPEARAKVQELIRSIHPDILAVQELGGPEAARELTSALARRGLDLPHQEIIRGPDTNICLAVFSRFPITARRPHTNEAFLLDGRRFRVSRGFLEVDIAVTPEYRLTLLNAHLKSKRAIAEADEAELREQEALRLRRLIEAALTQNRRANLLVCGDLNDSKDARPIRVLLGASDPRLVDARPSERRADSPPTLPQTSRDRTVTWTHYFAQEDTYSRFDYLLMSRGLVREWRAEESYVLAAPDWGLASDHRPVVAVFTADDR